MNIIKNYDNDGVNPVDNGKGMLRIMYGLASLMEDHEIVYAKGDYSGDGGNLNYTDFFVLRPKGAGSNPPGQNWTIVFCTANNVQNIANIEEQTPDVWYQACAKMVPYGEYWRGETEQFDNSLPSTPWIQMHISLFSAITFHAWEQKGIISVAGRPEDGDYQYVFYAGMFDPVVSREDWESIVITSKPGGILGNQYSWNGVDNYAFRHTGEWVSASLAGTQYPEQNYSLSKIQKAYYPDGTIPFLKPIPVLINGGQSIIGQLPLLYANGEFGGFLDGRHLDEGVAYDNGKRIMFKGVSFPW